jgi:inosose dehydratase
MDKAEWTAFTGRFRDIARMGTEEYGLDVSLHPHAAGFMDFEPEVERLLAEIDEKFLKICLDTGHCHYAGFDPVPFLKRHLARVTYVHFKDINPTVRADVIKNRAEFLKACAQGIFCNLGDGMTDFKAVRKLLVESGYKGWCTVEQDCDPTGPTSPVDDARYNRKYLESIGF